MSKRVGDWFQTHNGIKFYPLDPRTEEIQIGDIAHALARVCRFGGHTREFYSVAQHCLLVSRIVSEEWALEGLLHDASEAYLGDMVRPLKLQMHDYYVAEQNLERVIAEKFGLLFPWSAEIKAADNTVLITEKRDLLEVDVPWSWSVPPLRDPIVPMAIEDAERAFLERFAKLQPTHERCQRCARRAAVCGCTGGPKLVSQPEAREQGW